MNIDDLTLGQIKAIQAMKCDTAKPASACGQNLPATPVVVCTDKRGVIFGYTHDYNARPILLHNARMCLYWSADVGVCSGLPRTARPRDAKSPLWFRP